MVDATAMQAEAAAAWARAQAAERRVVEARLRHAELAARFDEAEGKRMRRARAADAADPESSTR